MLSMASMILLSKGSAWGFLHLVVFAPDQIRMLLSLQSTRFAIFNPEQSSFLVYMILEWNFVPERESFIS